MNPSNANEGNLIYINKALTVNGSSIEGLIVRIESSVSSDVTLKNFKKAKIEIVAPTPAVQNPYINRFSRSAYNIADIETENESGEIQKIEKFGDGVLPLRLEGCEIDELRTEKPITLYLETGDEKSSIEELKILEGAESFTFIEKDDDVAAADKSSVEKLFIEKSEVEHGDQEINLIGGTFGDVDFADDFTSEDKLRFKYDAEFEQFEDKEFMEEDFIEEKDIALADYDVTNGSGIYKFTMTRAEFERLNGYLGVVFLNDTHKAAIQNYTMDIFETWMSASYEQPMYDMAIMGSFKVFEVEQAGLKPIYGRNDSYLDYSGAFFGDSWHGYITKQYLTEYMHYSKDAVVVNVGNESVDLYVNAYAITKKDLSIHVGVQINGESGICEGGSKLTKLDLTGYKPYLIVNTGIHEEGLNPIYRLLYGTENPNDVTFDTDENPIFSEAAAPVGFLNTWLNKRTIYFPCTSDQKSDLGDPDYHIFPMTQTTDEYPNVASVEIPQYEIARDRITVRYYDPTATTFLYENTDEVKLNLNPFSSAFEYYYDSEFKYKLLIGTGSQQENFDWDFDPSSIPGYSSTTTSTTSDKGSTENGKGHSSIVLYARPKRSLTIWTSHIVPDTNPTVYEMGINIGENINTITFPNMKTNLRYLFYKSYNPATKEFSDRIYSPTEISDGDSLYLADAYVTLVAASPTDSTKTQTIGVVRVWDLPIYETPDSPARSFYSSPSMDTSTRVYKDALMTYAGDTVYTAYNVRVNWENDNTMDFIAFTESLATHNYYFNQSYTSEAEAQAGKITVANITAYIKEHVDWYYAGNSAYIDVYDSYSLFDPIPAPAPTPDPQPDPSPVSSAKNFIKKMMK